MVGTGIYYGTGGTAAQPVMGTTVQTVQTIGDNATGGVIEAIEFTNDLYMMPTARITVKNTLQYAWGTVKVIENFKGVNCQDAVDTWNDIRCRNTWTSAYNCTYCEYQPNASTVWQFPKKSLSLEEKISEIIQSRHSPHIITSRKPLSIAVDQRELRARETLRRVLGDQKFYSFLKKGFISVMAKSGLVYQIFPGHGFTNVWNNGKQVDCLCVILKGDFPPTDSLIMRYLLVLNNEDQFRSLANKQSIETRMSAREVEVPTLSLVELFRDLKQTYHPRRKRVAA